MQNLSSRYITYFFGGIFSQLLMFVIWFTFSWQLPPSEIGMLSLVMFSIEIVTIISMMGVDSSLIRFVGNSKNPHSIFLSGIIISTTSLIILIILYFFLSEFKPFANRVIIWINDNIEIFIISCILNLILNIIQSYQISCKNAVQYVKFQIIRNSLNLVISYLMLSVNATVVSTIIGFSASTFIVIIGYIYYYFSEIQYSSGKIRFDKIKIMVNYGFPLMLYAIVGLITIYTQRFTVEHYSNEAVFGVFTFFNLILLQINGLWGGINKTWTPEFFELIKEDKNKAMGLLRGMIVIVSIFCLTVISIIVIAGESFVNKLIFKEQYLDNIKIFYMLLISICFTGLYTVAYPLYYIEKQTNKIFFISLIVSLINIFLCIMLTSNYGVSGAAISILIISAVTLWGYLICFRDWIDEKFVCLKIILIVTIGCFCSGSILIFANSRWIFILGLFITGILTWIYGNNLSKPFFKIIFYKK